MKRGAKCQWRSEKTNKRCNKIATHKFYTILGDGRACVSHIKAVRFFFNDDALIVKIKV